MPKINPNLTHVLRVECKDAVGLIHKITSVLYRAGLNIIQNDEFVDRGQKKFFMRTEFSGRPDPARILRELKKLLPGGAKLTLTALRKKDIVIFVTKEVHCLGDLLIRHAYGELNANILAVFSNYEFLRPLAEKFDIPYHAVSYDGRRQKSAEAEILSILSTYRPEYLVLAKFMRILSEGFVGKFPSRIINIHHSFLPAFTGHHPYQQAAERGVKIIGATAHFVTRELDKGPIIAQDVVPISHSHSAEDMAQAGRDVEKTVLAHALKLAFEDRIFVCGNKTVIFD